VWTDDHARKPHDLPSPAAQLARRPAPEGWRGIEFGLSSTLMSPRRRGPQKAPTKQRITLRLSPQVVQHYKAGGPGWQTRIDLDLQGKIGARNNGRGATASAPRRRMKAKAA
jgi:uncharacterized protein (DUF4415 family)